jgi:ribosomal protein S18 acetylase RimI-like enzyme
VASSTGAGHAVTPALPAEARSTGSRTLPLRRLAGRDLRALLDEEASHWDSELFWDFREVGAAVAAGLDRGTLQGRYVEEGGVPAAYCYYVREAGRTVVGSVFAAGSARDRGHEARLVEDVLAEVIAAAEDERLECQTLFCTDRRADSCFSGAGFAGRARHYMVRDLSEPLPTASAPGIRLRPVRRDDLALAARVIHRSHEGTVDAALNLTYATEAHCRAFVDTLVLRAGCGAFDPEASLVAEADGRAAGVLLASVLSSRAGHVCQVSVEPRAQRRGVGAALMVEALRAFRREGLSHASLSVTVDNRHAYRLYERLDFRVRRPFAAHAWLRPPARIGLPA